MSEQSGRGIEELRRAVNLFGNTCESFNQDYSAEQLITIYRAYLASGWDITPDRWTARQTREALAGHMPQWEDEDGSPGRAIYADGTKQPARDSYLCDACGVEIANGEHCTDEEVCGGSDDPGFFLCETCITKHADLAVEARREIYTAQREANDAREF